MAEKIVDCRITYKLIPKWPVYGGEMDVNLKWRSTTLWRITKKNGRYYTGDINEATKNARRF